MFSDQSLIILQKDLNYHFSDISNLKWHLIRYVFEHFSNDIASLPFQEDIKKYDFPSFSSVDFLLTLDERKKAFFTAVNNAMIKLDNFQAENDRNYMLLGMNINHSIFLAIADSFNIDEFGCEKLMPDAANFEMLLSHKVLYIFNAIFQDAEQHQIDLTLWVTETILPLCDCSYNDVLEPVKLPENPLVVAQQYLLNTLGISRESIKPEEKKVIFDLPPPEKIESFESKILNLKLSEINSQIFLEKLAPQFDDPAKEVRDYYKQFLPYIIEESRAAIAEQLKLISNNRGIRPFNITFASKPKAKSDEIIDCSFWLKHLPTLDHPFNMEVLLIQKTGGKKKHSPEIMVVATKAYTDKKAQKTFLKLKMLSRDIENNGDLFSEQSQWTARWLSGVVSHARMYEVCMIMPRVKFLNQFVSGKLPNWPEVETPADENPTLNNSQRSAVEQFNQAESGLFLLQGPPGTGKTTTIVNLLSELLKSSDEFQRIMVCAPSNKAIRLLARRTHEFLPDADVVLTGVGKDLPEELKDIFISDYVEGRCVEIQDLLKGFQSFHNQFIKSIQLNQKKTNHLEECEQKTQKLIESIMRPYKVIKKLMEKSAHGQDFTAKHRVEKLFESLTAHSQVLADLVEKCQLLTKECLQKIAADQLAWPTLHEAQSEKSHSSDEYVKAFSEAYKQIETIVNQCLEEMYSCREQVEILMLQQAKIVFSTLVSSGRNWIKKYIDGIDILIIDEATQAVEPEVLIPFAFMPKKCLQVGDTKQLPATVLSKSARKKGFDQSMMYRLLEVCSQPFQMLDIQYRMHPAICRWPSKQNYHGRLVTAPGLDKRKSPFAETDVNKVFLKPCLFININSVENRKDELSQSIKNEKEADIVIKTLIYLLKFYNNSEVGIITFYKAQKDLLQLSMNRTKLISPEKKQHVMISTVDGFQGEEKDIILISAVRTNESAGFLRDIRRINVAVTRPRHHLYIFGNQEPLAKSNSDFSCLIKDYHDSVEADIVQEDQLSWIINNPRS